LPAMKSRKHVLDGMPDDIKRYCLYEYILEWNVRDSRYIAKALHVMAAISKDHHQEVMHVIQNESAIALAYTEHAMRTFVESAISVAPDKKSRLFKYLSNKNSATNHYDVDLYNFRKKVRSFTKSYPTLSVNLSTKEKKQFNSPAWLKIAMEEIFNVTPCAKKIRLNFSRSYATLESRNGHYRIFNMGSRISFANVPAQYSEDMSSAPKLISEVVRQKNTQKDENNEPIIELIIHNNRAALREISELPISLNLQLLDATGTRSHSRQTDQHFSSTNFSFLVNRFDLESLSIYLAKTECRLTTLILRDCSMDSSALAELANGLEKNKSVRNVDLSNNLVRRPGVHGLNTYDGLKRFCEVLSTSTNLIQVNLENCRLRDGGANLLYEALKTNQHLRSLDLGNNIISADHPIWGDTRTICSPMPPLT
jgi:hypothetical protein